MGSITNKQLEINHFKMLQALKKGNTARDVAFITGFGLSKTNGILRALERGGKIEKRKVENRKLFEYYINNGVITEKVIKHEITAKPSIPDWPRVKFNKTALIAEY